MTLLIVSTLLFLVVLPLATLAWLVRRSSCRLLWDLKALAVGAYVLVTYYLGGWHMLSYNGRYVLLGLFVVAMAVGIWRMKERPLWTGPTGPEWIGPLLAGILLVLSGGGLVSVYQAHDVPTDPVDLSFPLRNGAFYVASGGSNDLMNPHMKVASPTLQNWRGQMWALDIVQLYPSGNRASGLYPTTLDRYAIFGTSVYAPCEGVVAATEDGHPDRSPPTRDTTHKAGNYVTVQCGPEAYVLLAHLQHNSVRVAPGDSVSTDTELGRVGNSGNSWEPHLHVNAQRGVGDNTVADADPRPMTFNGTYPVRNDVLQMTGE